jgi:hypothetical protein
LISVVLDASERTAEWRPDLGALFSDIEFMAAPLLTPTFTCPLK